MPAAKNPKAHRFEPTILREYDIRGVVDQTLGEADALAIGRAFGSIVRRKGGRTVAVGRDGRLHSPRLRKALVTGLNEAGANVVDIGLCSTPMLYFSVFHHDADAGIMVTGSHNPPDQNGFKLMLGKKSFFGKDIQKLGRIAQRADFERGRGRTTRKSVTAAYVRRVARDYHPGRPLSVAWDIGNGAVGVSIARVLAALRKKDPKSQHHVLFETVDGRFPNHHPDPTVEANLADLRKTVKRERCDLGIAFDGDGDRIGAIDGRGRVLWGDQLLVLWARDVLKRHPGSTIIADVKASQVLFDEVKAAGGEPLMWKTGHSLIKQKMADLGAPLAGEMSGHIFFAESWYGFDDALYAAVRLLNVLAHAPQGLAAMRDGLPQPVNTPELRFACPDTRKFAVVEEVKARLGKARARFSDVDGVRVQTADGWWLLRASNTQAVLVARCEAKDAAGLARLKADLAAALAKSGVELPEGAGGGH
jgi:phosphomannomutase